MSSTSFWKTEYWNVWRFAVASGGAAVPVNVHMGRSGSYWLTAWTVIQVGGCSFGKSLHTWGPSLDCCVYLNPDMSTAFGTRDLSLHLPLNRPHHPPHRNPLRSICRLWPGGPRYRRTDIHPASQGVLIYQPTQGKFTLLEIAPQTILKRTTRAADQKKKNNVKTYMSHQGKFKERLPIRGLKKKKKTPPLIFFLGCWSTGVWSWFDLLPCEELCVGSSDSRFSVSVKCCDPHKNTPGTTKMDAWTRWRVVVQGF